MNTYDQRMRALGGFITSHLNGGLSIHVPEERLLEAESELGYTLPVDYREFVRDYGCSTFNVLTYPFKHPIPGWKMGPSLFSMEY